jgi:tryptophanyl-tRNA synthetase
MSKKILVSGIQPSGQPHIGNYFGAMKQYVDLQNDYESYIFVANYHAMTTTHDAQILQEQTLDVAVDLLAVGVDPEKTTLYLQTAVPEVTELTWIFNTLVTVPYLSRAHAYKDKTAKGLEANAGLFDYPVLMAADILLPDAAVVPVGADQKQHVEYARDIAEKFNTAYGQTFALPEPLIVESVAVVPGTDGQKNEQKLRQHHWALCHAR